MYSKAQNQPRRTVLCSCRVFVFVLVFLAVEILLVFQLKFLMTYHVATVENHTNFDEIERLNLFDHSIDNIININDLAKNKNGTTRFVNVYLCDLLLQQFLKFGASYKDHKEANRLFEVCEQELRKSQQRLDSMLDIVQSETQDELKLSNTSLKSDEKTQHLSQFGNWNVEFATRLLYGLKPLVDRFSRNSNYSVIEKEKQQNGYNREIKNDFEFDHHVIENRKQEAVADKASHIQEFRSRVQPGFSRSTSNPLGEVSIVQLRRLMFLQYGTWYGCYEDSAIIAMKGLENKEPLIKKSSWSFLDPGKKNNSSKGILEERIENSELSPLLNGERPSSLDGQLQNGLYNGLKNNVETDPTDVENAMHKDSDLQMRGISPLAKPPYRFALLFMIHMELRHPRLWTEWLDDAYRWSYELYRNREGPYSVVNDEPFEPLYSLHVHFMGGSSGVYTSLKNIWKKLGLIIHTDSYNKTVDYPVLKLPKIFQDAIIPSVHCTWGNLNPCAYQLVKFGLRDPSTNGYALISESAVPVKPFRFIYDEYQQNPRSRFFFSNINLPLIRKHHQWIVLNRQHATRLIEHPEKWTCNSWMLHHYSQWHVIGNFAASDEYLPFYAISDLIGIDTVMLEINHGSPQNLRTFNNTYQVYGNRNFRHTWLCWWELPDYIESEPCDSVGQYSTRLSSPVTYHKIFADKFLELVIKNRNTWFARKFEKDCVVEVSSLSNEEQIHSIQQESQNSMMPLNFLEMDDIDGDILGHDIKNGILEADDIDNRVLEDNIGHPAQAAPFYQGIGIPNKQKQHPELSNPAIGDPPSTNIETLEDWLIKILLRGDYFSSLPLHVYDDSD